MLGVDFGQLEIDNGLEELNNWASEVRLDRETDRRTIFDLDIKAGDSFAAFFTSYLNLEVKLVL